MTTPPKDTPTSFFPEAIDNRFDIVLPFHLEKSEIRGRLVRLDESMKTIIRQHQYPELVNQYLGQAAALSLAIINCFKLDGKFTLQISGDGPLRLLIIDANSQGHLRACARFNEENLKKLSGEERNKLHHVFGTANMVMTLDPTISSETYQGVVELIGTSLAASANHFFKQSEQLETGIVAVSSQVPGTLSSAALMIQRLPLPKDITPDEKEQLDDKWIHALSLTGSASKKELLDPTLTNRDILFRLFWEEGVRVHKAKPYEAHCRCSTDRIKEMLNTFTGDDRQDMLQDDLISVTCEFCGTTYTYTQDEFDEI